MKDFSGVYTALITPFYNGDVDEVSLRRLVRQQLDAGVHGLVVSGTTGESPTLSADEKKNIFSLIKSEVAGQVPLVVGTGSNSTAATVAATRLAHDWGADAALVVVPYYNKPPQRGLFQHFQKVAEASDLPIILYNVPSRTITRLEKETVVELSRVRGIVGIKEATGDMEFGRALLAECKSGFAITSGDDGSFLSLALLGGAGVISVASHLFAKEFAKWFLQARAGETEPLNEFQRIQELNDFLYCEANPIPLKMALKLTGVIRSAELRLPLVELSEPNTMRLRELLLKAGLL